jgi:hypothetical protein
MNTIDLKAIGNAQLAPRRFGSFTPDPVTDSGLLIDKDDAGATKQSFAEINAADDFDRWNEFYAKTELIAQKLFGTVLEPLRTEREVSELLGPELRTPSHSRGDVCRLLGPLTCTTP